MAGRVQPAYINKKNLRYVPSTGLLLGTRENTLCTPLAWVVMALRLTEACDSSKLLLKLSKLSCLGQRPLELDLCNGSKQLWLLYSFLNILQCPKQPGCNEG